MVTTRDSLGSRLRSLRLQSGLSQVQLAKAVGRHQTAIGPYERDEYSPSRETINRFAKALGTTPEFLLFGREPHQASLVFGGSVGAGGMVIESEGRAPKRWLDIRDEGLVAFEISDSSMEPVFRRGGFVLVEGAAEEPGSHHFGADVLAELDDGRRFLRRLMPDQDPRRFVLSTYGNAIISGVACNRVQPVRGFVDRSVLLSVGRETNVVNL